MKAKKITAALLTAALAATAAVSVSAVELTNLSPNGSTEVTAKIQTTGEVNYVITIPEKVDFGTLTQPATADDSYKFIDFDITATTINFTSGAVSVWAKDSTSTDDQFYITQKGELADPFTIKYDFYDEAITDVTGKTPVNSETPSENGYHISTFNAASQGEVQDVTLVLNQNQLYGKDLETIAGDYSGNIIFHSAYNVAGV